MAFEWLKTILGDGYTPEIDAAISQEIGKAFVARNDFNAKSGRVSELEAEVGKLRDAVSTRDNQLAQLQKAAGDNTELQNQINALTEQNKKDKAAFEKELAKVRLRAAAEAELTAAGSRNNVAVMAVIGDEYFENADIVDGKVSSKVNGESVTLAARIDAMKKDAATDYLFGASSSYNGWKPGEGGDGKPGAGKKPSEMSYSELAEFLAANPNAKLD